MTDSVLPDISKAFDLTGRAALVTGSTSGIGKGRVSRDTDMLLGVTQATEDDTGRQFSQ